MPKVKFCGSDIAGWSKKKKWRRSGREMRRTTAFETVDVPSRGRKCPVARTNHSLGGKNRGRSKSTTSLTREEDIK